MPSRPPDKATAPTREPIARYFFGATHTARPVVDDLPLPDYQRERAPVGGESVYDRVRRG